MKSPEYVGFVTKMYRELIDNHKTNQTEKNLKFLFNREFTEGHLLGKKDKDLMNIKSPNHIGNEIGQVQSIKNKIKIKLTDDLSQNDGIRFKESKKGLIVNKLYNDKGLLVNSAKKDQIVYIDNKIHLTSLDTVLKTTDFNLIENLKQYNKKQMPVIFNVIAKENQNLQITITDNKYKITKVGNKIQKSVTSPITKENIIKQLSKLGNNPFMVNNINVEMDDNIFISLKELNELRRSLIQNLIDEKTKINRNTFNIVIPKIEGKQNKDININAFVRTENQLKTIINKVNKIYTDDFNLYSKYKHNNVFFRVDRTITKLENLENENLLLTELGSVNKYPENNNCISDYFLNIVNTHSINFLKSKNIKQITISPELTLDQIKDIAKTNNDIEIIIYGTLELMIINHCIIKMNDNCPNCKNNKYYLKNKQNELFPIITKNCKNHIMHHKKTNLINNINKFKELGITNYRLEFFDEDEKQILNILDKLKE